MKLQDVKRVFTWVAHEVPIFHRAYLIDDDQGGPSMYWSMNYIHFELLTRGLTVKNTRLMRTWIQQLPDLQGHFKIDDGTASDGTHSSTGNVVSSQAGLSALAIMATNKKLNRPLKSQCLKWLSEIVKISICGGLNKQCSVILKCVQLHISSKGVITTGVENLVEKWNSNVKKAWYLERAARGFEPTNLDELFEFVVQYNSSKIATHQCKNFMKELMREMICFIVPLMEKVVLDQATDAKPRLTRNPNSNRQHGALDPHTAWEVLEEAKRCFCANERIIIDVNAKQPEYNKLSRSNGMKWATLELALYIEVNQDIFHNLCKFYVGADPSTYQGQETMVGIIYSWENEQATCSLPQILPATNFTQRQEILMDDALWENIQSRKVVRLRGSLMLVAFYSFCETALAPADYIYIYIFIDIYIYIFI